jgi:hypothetical protein
MAKEIKRKHRKQPEKRMYCREGKILRFHYNIFAGK